MHQEDLRPFFKSDNPNLGFPGGSVVDTSPANARDTEDGVLILGQKDPVEEEMATHSSILAGKSHGQRGWLLCGLGYSPWGHKESDRTE